MAQTPLSGTGRTRAEAMKRKDRFVRNLEGHGSAYSHLRNRWKAESR